MRLSLVAHDGAILRVDLDGDEFEVDVSSSSRLFSSGGTNGIGVDAITTVALEKADAVESALGTVRDRLHLSDPSGVTLTLLETPSDVADEASPPATLVVMRSERHATIWRPRPPFDRPEDVIHQATSLAVADEEHGVRIDSSEFRVDDAAVTLHVAGAGVLTTRARQPGDTPRWRGAMVGENEVWRETGPPGLGDQYVVGSSSATGVVVGVPDGAGRSRAADRRAPATPLVGAIGRLRWHHAR